MEGGDVLTYYSKRVEGQIQGIQDKSETLKSEVCGVPRCQFARFTHTVYRSFRYNQRHNSHNRARRHEVE